MGSSCRSSSTSAADAVRVPACTGIGTSVCVSGVTDFSCSFIDDDDDPEETAAVNVDGTLDPDGDYRFSTRILSANYRCAPLGSTGILVWVIDLVEDADEVAGKVKDDIRGEIGSYTREFER